MDMGERAVIKNGRVKHHLKQAFVLSILGFLSALFLWVGFHDVTGIFLGSLLVILAIIQYVSMDIILRPRELILDGTGITLTLRGKSQYHPWGSVEGVIVLPPSHKIGFMGGRNEGRLRIKGQRTMFTLTYDTAVSVKDHYDRYARSAGLQQTYLNMPPPTSAFKSTAASGDAPIMIRNKMDSRFLALAISLFIIGGLMFILALFAAAFYQVCLTILILFPLSFLTLWAQVRTQPSHISVDEQGFHLFMRGSGVRSYRWDQLTYINELPYDPARVPPIRRMNFVIMVEGKTTVYRVSVEPALAMQRAYTMHTGSMMPTLKR